MVIIVKCVIMMSWIVEIIIAVLSVVLASLEDVWAAIPLTQSCAAAVDSGFDTQ